MIDEMLVLHKNMYDVFKSCRVLDVLDKTLEPEKDIIDRLEEQPIFVGRESVLNIDKLIVAHNLTEYKVDVKSVALGRKMEPTVFAKLLEKIRMVEQDEHLRL